MIQLEKQDYAHVRDLFAPVMDLNGATAAVLEGWNPGIVFVDDSTQPSVAFMGTPEGSVLVGTASPANVATMRTFVSDELFTKREWRYVYLLAAGSWIPLLAELMPQPPLPVARRKYLCHQVTHGGQATLPEGFSTHQLTADVLARLEQTTPSDDEPWQHVRGWIDNNWGGAEAFLRDAFGFVTLYDNKQIASWSLADCRSQNAPLGSSCEIGIQTRADYRRRGLAVATAAASAAYALAHGYDVVGWHCNEDNAGSIGTAEKVGFTLERKYTEYYCCRDEQDYIALRDRL